MNKYENEVKEWSKIRHELNNKVIKDKLNDEKYLYDRTKILKPTTDAIRRLLERNQLKDYFLKKLKINDIPINLGVSDEDEDYIIQASNNTDDDSNDSDDSDSDIPDIPDDSDDDSVIPDIPDDIIDKIIKEEIKEEIIVQSKKSHKFNKEILKLNIPPNKTYKYLNKNEIKIRKKAEKKYLEDLEKMPTYTLFKHLYEDELKGKNIFAVTELYSTVMKEIDINKKPIKDIYHSDMPEKLDISTDDYIKSLAKDEQEYLNLLYEFDLLKKYRENRKLEQKEMQNRQRAKSLEVMKKNYDLINTPKVLNRNTSLNYYKNKLT